MVDWSLLFPTDVSIASCGSEPPLEKLHVLEETFIAEQRLFGVRELDFRRGRLCARLALSQLGVDESAVLPAATREPLWPEGLVGSITHCDGLTAAAVAPTTIYCGLGLDAERRGRVSAEVLDIITTPTERAARPPQVAPGDWLGATFSAKEAVFKACFPLTRQFLDFLDVDVSIDWRSGAFLASTPPGQPRLDYLLQLEGRLAFTPTHIVARVLWPRQAST
jgi:4'-phosphopantetheinyl transferase EntD